MSQTKQTSLMLVEAIQRKVTQPFHLTAEETRLKATFSHKTREAIHGVTPCQSTACFMPHRSQRLCTGSLLRTRQMMLGRLTLSTRSRHRRIELRRRCQAKVNMSRCPSHLKSCQPISKKVQHGMKSRQSMCTLRCIHLRQINLRRTRTCRCRHKHHHYLTKVYQALKHQRLTREVALRTHGTKPQLVYMALPLHPPHSVHIHRNKFLLRLRRMKADRQISTTVSIQRV